MSDLIAKLVNDSDFRNGLRSYPDLIKILVKKLIEGLDATEVKTASYQGDIPCVKEFVDYPTRLAYIKAINDIAQLSSTDFSKVGNTLNSDDLPEKITVDHIGSPFTPEFKVST